MFRKWLLRLTVLYLSLFVPDLFSKVMNTDFSQSYVISPISYILLNMVSHFIPFSSIFKNLLRNLFEPGAFTSFIWLTAYWTSIIVMFCLNSAFVKKSGPDPLSWNNSSIFFPAFHYFTLLISLTSSCFSLICSVNSFSFWCNMKLSCCFWKPSISQYFL